MIPWLLEALSPTFVPLAVLASALAVGSGTSALRGWRAHRRARSLDGCLLAVAEPVVLCPACGVPSTWDETPRCGCWSGR